MASSKQIDLDVIVADGQPTKLRGFTIADIISVYKNNDNVTVVKYVPKDDNHTSLTPRKIKVSETLAAVLVKANASDSNNGLIQVTVTKANGSVLATPRVQVINREKFQPQIPLYDENGAPAGTKIKYGSWRQTILEVSENLVAQTPSS